MYSSRGTGAPKAGAPTPKVAAELGKVKNLWAKKKSRPQPKGARSPMVRQNEDRENFTCSLGSSQKAITIVGITKSRRLHVYQCGVGFDVDSINLPGSWTVFNVIAAGSASMPSMAKTTHGATREPEE